MPPTDGQTGQCTHGTERIVRTPIEGNIFDDPETPLVLDLFCGHGGVGHALAELDQEINVIGFDIEDQSDTYPGHFVQADLRQAPFIAPFADLIWASPPCTPYSSLSPTYYGSREAALQECFRYLHKRDVDGVYGGYTRHYVIENVPGATDVGDLDTNVRLNGLAFGQPYDLERHFQTSFDCPNAVAPGTPDVTVDTRDNQSVEALAEAKGVPASWGKQGVRSAIPEEYVYWLLHHSPIETLEVPKPECIQPDLSTFDQPLVTDGGERKTRRLNTGNDRSNTSTEGSR